MTDNIENQTLALLREIRGDIGDVRKDIKILDAKVNTLAEGQLRITTRLDKIEKDVSEIKNHLSVVSIVVDEHASRLDSLEHPKQPV